MAKSLTFEEEIKGWIEFSKIEGIEDLIKVANSTYFWNDYARETAKAALDRLGIKP